MMQGAVGDGGDRATARLFGPMLGIFLGGGMLAAVEALLVPRLRLTLGLGYAGALSVQLAYYASYLVFAWPAAALLARNGAARALGVGTGAVAAGTLAIAAALATRSFAATVAALLVASMGATILQIAGNGVAATLGERGRATARFTALQGFNSLGTVVGPLLATDLLLAPHGAVAPLVPFVAFAVGFAVLAAAFHRVRDLLPRAAAAAPRGGQVAALVRRPAVAGGALAIFAYVGAEVTIGSLIPSYLMLPPRGGLAAADAGRLVSLYWLGAMIGRFAGAGLLVRIAAPTMLAIVALAAAALAVVAAGPSGIAGAVALIAVGLANAIMFPTIFALAMPDAPRDMPAAAMLMCMAVVGGAIVPFATGLVADRAGLSPALLLPAACYAVVFGYARYRGRRE